MRCEGHGGWPARAADSHPDLNVGPRSSKIEATRSNRNTSGFEFGLVKQRQLQSGGKFAFGTALRPLDLHSLPCTAEKMYLFGDWKHSMPDFSAGLSGVDGNT